MYFCVKMFSVSKCSIHCHLLSICLKTSIEFLPQFPNLSCYKCRLRCEAVHLLLKHFEKSPILLSHVWSNLVYRIQTIVKLLKQKYSILSSNHFLWTKSITKLNIFQSLFKVFSTTQKFKQSNSNRRFS